MSGGKYKMWNISIGKKRVWISLDKEAARKHVHFVIKRHCGGRGYTLYCSWPAGALDLCMRLRFRALTLSVFCFCFFRACVCLVIFFIVVYVWYSLMPFFFSLLGGALQVFLHTVHDEFSGGPADTEYKIVPLPLYWTRGWWWLDG